MTDREDKKKEALLGEVRALGRHMEVFALLSRQYGSALNAFQAVVPLGALQLSEQFSAFQKMVPDIGMGRLHEIVKIGSAIKRIKSGLAGLPDDIKSSIQMAANRGWFLDVEMAISDLRQIARHFEEDFDLVDSVLVDEYEGRLEKISAFVSGQFPHRNQIVRSVFKAHKEGMYELSVLGAFSQADGICHEQLGESFFLREEGKPKTAKASKVKDALENQEDIMAWFMVLLAAGLPIHKSANQRIGKPDIEGPNRHAIMHGECLDYGTKVNSLKAISLLNYVCQMTEEQQEGA